MMNLKSLVVPIMTMSIIVLVSNILVQFLLGNWLTWGALTYPFAFLVTDITNRFYAIRSKKGCFIWFYYRYILLTSWDSTAR